MLLMYSCYIYLSELTRSHVRPSRAPLIVRLNPNLVVDVRGPFTAPAAVKTPSILPGAVEIGQAIPMRLPRKSAFPLIFVFCINCGFLA